MKWFSCLEILILLKVVLSMPCFMPNFNLIIFNYDLHICWLDQRKILMYSIVIRMQSFKHVLPFKNTRGEWKFAARPENDDMWIKMNLFSSFFFSSISEVYHRSLKLFRQLCSFFTAWKINIQILNYIIHHQPPFY